MRIFKRRRKAEERPQRMMPDSWQDSPENWTPGDVAICKPNTEDGDIWINATNGYPAPGPAVGSMNHVAMVMVCEGRQFLGFNAWPGLWYLAICFVKAKPDAISGSRSAWTKLFNRHRSKVPVDA